MAETETFSVEAVIFVFILLIYVLTAHLVEVKKVNYGLFVGTLSP